MVNQIKGKIQIYYYFFYLRDTQPSLAFCHTLIFPFTVNHTQFPLKKRIYTPKSLILDDVWAIYPTILNLGQSIILFRINNQHTCR